MRAAEEFQLCAWLPAVVHPGRNPVFVGFVLHKLFRLLTPWALAFVGVALVGLATAYNAGVTAVVVAVAAGGLSVSRRARSLTFEVVLAQWSAVRAVLNGFRGRWDVW